MRENCERPTPGPQENTYGAACCGAAYYDAATSGDGDGDGDGGDAARMADKVAGGEDDAWLSALTDAQLLSAQQAFQRAQMAALDYLEGLKAELADGMAPHRSGAPARPCAIASSVSGAAAAASSHFLL